MPKWIFVQLSKLKEFEEKWVKYEEFKENENRKKEEEKKYKER